MLGSLVLNHETKVHRQFDLNGPLKNFNSILKLMLFENSLQYFILLRAFVHNLVNEKELAATSKLLHLSCLIP